MQSLQALGSEKWLSTQFRFQSIADNETFYIFATLSENARVAELVDALDSKSSFFGSAGSIPAPGTKREIFEGLSPVSILKPSNLLVIWYIQANPCLNFGVR